MSDDDASRDLLQEREARLQAERTLHGLRAVLEEARNHLMDARSGHEDEAAFEASLDAVDDLLGRAEEDAMEHPVGVESGIALTADFLREANHAIRGTLGGAVGHLDLLRDTGSLDPEQVRRSVQAAWEASATADRFVQEFFDVASAWSQGPTVPTRAVSVAALLEEVIKVAEAQADSRRVRVHTEIEKGSQRARVDPDGFQEMVEMMLEHAVDAAPAGSDVLVRVRDDASTLRVEIAHEGRCPWSAERHFQPFEPAEPGSPIGLCALKHLTRMRAGQAGVDPTEPRGEVVWVQLPHWQEPAQGLPAAGEVEGEAQETQKEAPASGTTPKILIVEDDRQDLDSLRTMVEEAGYEATTVTTVDQAVAAVEEHTFDAITLDLLLGRSYSTRVLAAARNGRNADAAILVLSATRPGNVAFPFPVQGHLQKPVYKRTLLRALRWSRVPPPIGGPVIFVGREPPPGFAAEFERWGRRLLHAPDPDAAKELLDEDPVVVVIDPGRAAVGRGFLDALQGATLVLWGDQKPSQSRLRQAASATLRTSDGKDALLRELGRILDEQASLTSLEGGSL